MAEAAAATEQRVNPIDAALNTVYKSIDAIARSGKNIIKDMNAAANIDYNFKFIVEFFTQVVQDKPMVILPEKVNNVLDVIANIIEVGFTAGVFGIGDATAINNSLHLLRSGIKSEIVKHAEKERADQERRAAAAQEKLAKINAEAAAAVPPTPVVEASEDNVAPVANKAGRRKK